MNLEDYKNTVDTFLKLTFKKQINTIDRSLNKLSTEYKNDLLRSFFEDKEIILGSTLQFFQDKGIILLGYKSLSYIIRGIPNYYSTYEEIWEEFYRDIDDIFQAYCEILSDLRRII